jgi:hypothetical protein
MYSTALASAVTPADVGLKCKYPEVAAGVRILICVAAAILPRSIAIVKAFPL